MGFFRNMATWDLKRSIVAADRKAAARHRYTPRQRRQAEFERQYRFVRDELLDLIDKGYGRRVLGFERKIGYLHGRIAPKHHAELCGLLKRLYALPSWWAVMFRFGARL